MGKSVNEQTVTGSTTQDPATQVHFHIFETMPGNSILLVPDAPDYTIVAVTEGMIQRSGFSKLQLVGKPFFFPFPANPTNPEDPKTSGQDQTIASFEHVIRNKEPHHLPLIRYDLESADGTFIEFYWKVHHRPVLDESGKLIYIVHTSEDVTAITQQVIEREKQFQILLESIPQMTWTNLPTGEVNFYNQKWYEYTGLTFHETKAWGWQAVVHPDDLPATVAAYMHALKTNTLFEVENRYKKSDGTYRWHLNRALPIRNEFDEVTLWIGTATDIDERRRVEEAEERSRLSVLAAELGTFEVNMADGEALVSQRFNAIFGVSHKMARDYVSAFIPEDLELIRQAYHKARNTGLFDCEGRIRWPNESVHWVRVKGKIAFDNAGNAAKMLGVVQDVSEQKAFFDELEKQVIERTGQLQALNNELQRSNKYLEEFAHAASHDLKEPVRKINFFTQRLREQLDIELTEAQAGSFDRIENATLRMGTLIDDLLQYSHVSHLPLEMETVDINQQLKLVLDDLELDVLEKKATFIIGELPLVRGFRRQLQQLFQNLVSNALKYSKTDTPAVININARETVVDGKPYHEIHVSDNGIGFEQQYAEKIFQMFARLHGKHEYGGTGVGLSIVKKVVENHNGLIRAASVPDVGSTFTILLPRTVEES